MSKNYILVFVVLLSSHMAAQEVVRVPARFQSMGDASVSIQSPISIFSNPAGFAREDKLAFGINYESRFLLNDLQTSSAFFILPVSRTKFGLFFSQFGKEIYRENLYSLGVAKQLSKRLDGAIQLFYFNLKLPDNEHGVGALSMSAGMQCQLNNGFRLGVQILNPHTFSVQVLPVKLKYPTIYRLGCQKTFDELLLFVVEARKQIEMSPEFNCGVELRIKKQVQLRMGIQSRLSVFSLGVGYTLKHLQTDVSFQYHQYLGYSPAFTIYYQMP